MRDPERIERMLTEIRRIWKLHPDMRLGQLMYNLYATYAGRKAMPNCFDYFYVEDDGFYKFLKEQ